MTVQKLYLIAFIIACKYNEEKFISNDMFSGMIIGCNSKSLNILERRFLDTIEFCLFVEKQVYNQF